MKKQELVSILKESNMGDIIEAARDAGVFKELGRIIPRELSKDAVLLNLNLAMRVNCPVVGVSLYIPVAVSDEKGGRETVYNLPIGGKTLMGVHVCEKLTIYKTFYTRLDDNTYSVTIETMSGEVLYSGKGKLEIIDDRVGMGRLRIEPEDKGMAKGGQAWILWSCINVCYQ